MITNVFEALRGSPALNHENNIHEYVRYCAFKKTFELFGLNYDAVFEDGDQIIFLHIYIYIYIYNKALFFERFVEKS